MVFCLEEDMAKDTVGIFCQKENLRNTLKRRLKQKFHLLFPNSIEEANTLIENLNIICLVVYPVNQEVCLFTKFCILKKKFPFIPFLFLSENGDGIRLQACAELRNEIIYDINEELYLQNKVQETIDQAKFKNHFSLSDFKTKNIPFRQKKALIFIHKNFTKIKLATDVSSKIGISKNTFLKEFRENCNVSFKQYLIKMKMNYAVYLKQELKLSGKEIAFRCGYENEIYFYKAFKNHFGINFTKADLNLLSNSNSSK